jgi:hypothetical protein
LHETTPETVKNNTVGASYSTGLNLVLYVLKNRMLQRPLMPDFDFRVFFSLTLMKIIHSDITKMQVDAIVNAFIFPQQFH